MPAAPRLAPVLFQPTNTTAYAVCSLPSSNGSRITQIDVLISPSTDRDVWLAPAALQCGGHEVRASSLISFFERTMIDAQPQLQTIKHQLDATRPCVLFQVRCHLQNRGLCDNYFLTKYCVFNYELAVNWTYESVCEVVFVCTPLCVCL